MKTVGKQKRIDHVVKRIKQKAKEFDQEMLQRMIEAVQKKLRAMWRDGFLSIWFFFVVLAMLFLIKNNSAFHLLK